MEDLWIDGNRKLSCLEIIAQKDILQKNNIVKTVTSVMSDEEYERLCATVDYFHSQGYDDEEIADAYLMIVNDIRKEMLYFRSNKCAGYRYHSFKELEDEVYFNDDYMRRRMMGQQLADYIWENHVLIRRFFNKSLLRIIDDLTDGLTGKTPGSYLEIGPGDGQYLAEAVRTGGFGNYVGADVSPMSCEMTKQLLKYEGLDGDNVEVTCCDFTDFSSDIRFDAVCISEVLEHVEKPLEMLASIGDIIADNAGVYVHIPINAPSIWHIYLFHDVEEVRRMIEKAGFYAVDEFIATGGGHPLEEAVRRKTTVNYTALLKKR